MKIAVGVLSRNAFGLSAAISSMPRSRSIFQPVSCTIKSRANRCALSTRMVRTPLPAMRESSATKPARSSSRSAPLTAASYGPGESCSDVILRLVEIEAKDGA